MKSSMTQRFVLTGCTASSRRRILQSGTQQLQEQRFKSSSSAFWADIVPDSVQETVKVSLLKAATKENSRLWNSSNDRRNNNSNTTGGGMNGSTINQATTDDNEADDPLNDLYLTHAPKYWPDLPIPPDAAAAADPFALAKSELDTLSQSIRQDLIGTDHPILNQAASYFFEESNSSSSGAGAGKKVRPMMVLLLSRALANDSLINNNNNHGSSDSTSGGGGAVAVASGAALLTRPESWQRPDLPQAQRRLAEISEMIHTASLFHDDVIDGADTRRSAATVHVAFGSNKMAILAGDYLLARASIGLARLRHVQVVETMSTIIEHLVRGEVMQLAPPPQISGSSSSNGSNCVQQQSQYSNDNKNERLDYYLRKNFYKTGSLMANSCKSTALLGEYSADMVQASYLYGKHIGMAFQLVDDVLDFEGTLSSLGKPALSDLKAGLATAPVLLAAQEYPHPLNELIRGKFRQNSGDVDLALDCVQKSSGLERTKQLARVHAEHAMEAILHLRPSVHRDALVVLANKIVARTK